MKKLQHFGERGSEYSHREDSPRSTEAGKRRARRLGKSKGELANRLTKALHRQATEATILSHAHDDMHSSRVAHSNNGTGNNFSALLPKSFSSSSASLEPLLLRILDGREMSWTYLALCTVCSFPSFSPPSQWQGNVKDTLLTHFPSSSFSSSLVPEALIDVPASSLCWMCFDLKQHKDLQLGSNVYVSIESPQVIASRVHPFSIPLISHAPSCTCVDPEVGLQAEREERAMNRPQTSSLSSSSSSSSSSLSIQEKKDEAAILPSVSPHFPLLPLSAVKPYSNSSRYSIMGRIQKASVRLKPMIPLLKETMSFFYLQDNSGCLAIIEVPANLLDVWQWVLQSGEGAFIVCSNLRFRTKSYVIFQQVPKPLGSLLVLFNVNEVVWFRVTRDTTWSQISAQSTPPRYSGDHLTTDLPLHLIAATAVTDGFVATTFFRVSMTCEPVACVGDRLYVVSISLPPLNLIEFVEVNARSCVIVRVHEIHNLDHCLSHRLLLRDLLIETSCAEFRADMYTDILLIPD